jgi:hypothetical protein
MRPQFDQQVTVARSTNPACNGAYHNMGSGTSERSTYENNGSGAIYFKDGFWNLTAYLSGADKGGSLQSSWRWNTGLPGSIVTSTSGNHSDIVL